MDQDDHPPAPPAAGGAESSTNADEVPTTAPQDSEPTATQQSTPQHDESGPSSGTQTQADEPASPTTRSRLGQAMTALLQSFASLPPGAGSNTPNASATPAEASASAPGAAESGNNASPHTNQAGTSGTSPLFSPSSGLRLLVFTPPADPADAPRVFAEMLRSAGQDTATLHHRLQQHQEENATPSFHPVAGPPPMGHAFIEQPEPGAAAGASEGGEPSGPREMPAPPNLYYRLPFYALDGEQALLALPTQFLPRQMSSPTRATVMAPGTPVYLPRSSANLPFPVLLDWNGMAWPILNIQNPPPGTPETYLNDPRHPHFIAGPPFMVAWQPFTIRGTQTAEEQPSPEKAKAFVDTLETADAELRERMARLSIGDIGVFGGAGGAGGPNSSEEGELGCPVCLDPYDETSDRPEWIGGEAARENQVVVIPCPGFHSMHRKCLVEWLSSQAPSKWSCPMCRTSITPSDVVKGARRAGQQARQPQQQQQQQQQAATPTQANLAKEIEARAHSLREEIHRRERQRGFTCDYQACFPDYELPSATDECALDRHMIKLQPCGHELHLDCLTTSLRIKDDLRLEGGVKDEDEDEEDEEEEKGEGGEARGGASAIKTVGKWVECPVDRREVWAQIPVPRRRKRQPAADDELAAAGAGSGDTAAAAAAAAESEDLSRGQVHRLSLSPGEMPNAKRQVREGPSSRRPSGEAERADESAEEEAVTLKQEVKVAGGEHLED
ncbi:hypothetical protein BCV69DRAFT_284437 [Microstroma glucosiphilum]|uniref:RING-type domain-containing protein n=1 Tax=Pseudomicrostroma glucosiphilum TaxID=1684307 RepID=A0A316U1P7_9BASI|nr:hypothetical protein BCV69DRAFT_284437 [Pseudomicrostroma glucosiphilum]PWN19289.1 hypothetical protein BCV69DRAFT_284437 [Pseudomicrostroma glucosiphilum]